MSTNSEPFDTAAWDQRAAEAIATRCGITVEEAMENIRQAERNTDGR